MTIEKSKRLKRTQVIALVLLVASGLINFLDRSTLAIANHTIAGDLSLTPSQMGLLLSAFSLAYAFAQLPIGAILDRFGARITLGLGLFFWSLAQMCGGFVNSLQSFLLARVGLGIGEAPQFPAAAKVVSEWFNVRERGLPSGIFNMASSLGPAIAQPILTALLIGLGWRHMFVVTGLLGIVVAVIWYALYRNRRDVVLTAEENAFLDDGLPAGSSGGGFVFADWLGLFAQRNTWGVILGYVGVIYMVWLYLTWLPAYLEHDRHLSIASAGWVASIPFLFGTLGVLSGGHFADRLLRRGFSISASRKLPLCLGLVGSALFTLPVAYVDSIVTAVVCLCGALFCVNVAVAGAWSLVSVAVPGRMVASLGSLQNFGGYLGGSAAPFITGVVVERTHSFSNALVIASGVATFGALMYLVLVKLPTGEALRSVAVDLDEATAHS